MKWNETEHQIRSAHNSRDSPEKSTFLLIKLEVESRMIGSLKEFDYWTNFNKTSPVYPQACIRRVKAQLKRIK
jgi:hypothetical protein